MKHSQTLFQSARVPFLLLAPLPVLLGVSAALYGDQAISGWHIAMAVIAALCAHVSVNAYNEYEDFRSGLDQMTKRTPFSGGSGGLVDNPDAAPNVLNMGRSTLLICAVIGAYFVWLRGLDLLLFGLLGIVLILSYTPILNRHPFLCWLSPGLGFGVVMVLGTELALSGQITKTGMVLAIVMTLLGNNLLLLNQLPDIDADKRAGRRHLPIVYGKSTALVVYVSCVIASGITVVFGVLGQHLPVASLAALIPLALGIHVFMAMRNQLNEPAEHWIPSMGKNVAMTLVTPLLLGLGAVLFG